MTKHLRKIQERLDRKSQYYLEGYYDAKEGNTKDINDEKDRLYYTCGQYDFLLTGKMRTKQELNKL